MTKLISCRCSADWRRICGHIQTCGSHFSRNNKLCDQILNNDQDDAADDADDDASNQYGSTATCGAS